MNEPRPNSTYVRWKYILNNSYTFGPIWLFTIFVLIVLTIAVLASYVYVPSAMRSAAVEAAYRSNLETADQIKIARGYYTNNVVAKILASGALSASHNHRDHPNAIPLPATFVKDISDLLQDRDTTLSLVSPYPWPHRSERKLDDFEQTAWTSFQTNPSAVFSRQEVKGGRRTLRVAVADRMTSETCVNCHNSDARLAKRDWKVGDVRAVMEVTRVIEPLLEAADIKSAQITGVATAAALLAALALIGFSWLVDRRTREKNATDQRAHYLARFDPLTGTINRSQLQIELEGELSALRPNETLAALYIDLDRFKPVNDTLGHPVGDQLLQEVAKRLQNSVRRHDSVARLGGDEFCILLTGLHSGDQVGRISSRILSTLSMPYQIQGHRINISASIGVAMAPTDAADPAELLRKADMALYEAKAKGRNNFCVFEKDMDEKIQIRHALESDLRQAITSNEFELHYQPLFNLAENRIQGFEALIRWNHPRRGMVSPADFIPIAEDTGLIKTIGPWVLRRACMDAISWPSSLTVAVNLSSVQFDDNLLFQDISHALKLSGLAPDRLELEITESIILKDTQSTLKTLHALKDMGIKIAMDDFGTGYSSIGYLQKFPFDKVKIDRSFVDGISTNKNAISIVRAVVSMSRGLGISVTGEGVEFEADLECLRNEGCSHAQGYLIGKPVPVGSIPAVLAKTEAERAPRQASVKAA